MKFIKTKETLLEISFISILVITGIIVGQINLIYLLTFIGILISLWYFKNPLKSFLLNIIFFHFQLFNLQKNIFI